MIHSTIHYLRKYQVSYYRTQTINSKYYSCKRLVCTCIPQYFTQSRAIYYIQYQDSISVVFSLVSGL